MSRARFVACERKAAAAVGSLKFVGVTAEGTQVIHTTVPLLGAVDVNDVTLAVTFKRGGKTQIAELDSLWVANGGRWARIYTPTEYEAYKAGKCP